MTSPQTSNFSLALKSVPIVNGALAAGLSIALLNGAGTGSVFAAENAREYGKVVHYIAKWLEARPALLVEPLDLRTIQAHLHNIRDVFKPHVSELALLFGVSRQAVYDWIGGATPQDETRRHIERVSLLADKLAKEGVGRPDLLVRRKVQEGRSLLELLRDGDVPEVLIANVMDAGRASEAARKQSIRRTGERPQLSHLHEVAPSRFDEQT